MAFILRGGGLLVASLLLTACGPTAAAPSASSPGVTASPQPTAAPTATAAATAPIPSALPAAGTTVFAGYYTTEFQPALTLRIDKAAVALDCAPGYDCRGDADKNEAGWVDLVFGNLHGAELDIIRLDKVYDPKAPTKLIDPPTDLAAWLEALPGSGMAVLAAPKSVSIGGVAATQFDVRTPGELQLGHIAGTAGDRAGIGPNGLRIIVMRVHGVVVVMTEWLAEENTSRDGAAALTSLQPLMDSIAWS